ncbi:MAG TPA: hypothetical protein VGD36_17575, partial [Xanthobacteraceae bacterium]
ATIEREQGANVWITFAIREGKNREVKNVMGHLGLAVNRLIRVSFGPFQLGELVEGAVEDVKTRTLGEQLGERITAAAGADFSAPLVEREVAPVGRAETPPLSRHPVAAAKRPSKGDGPGRASFEARARARAPQDDGAKPLIKRRNIRHSDAERMGGPERARLEKRRGRRPHPGKTR